MFIHRVLSRLFYNIPETTDRYIALTEEIWLYVNANIQNGLHCIVAVGTFEIGMESLLLYLAENFNRKIYMNDERREFLQSMEIGDDDDTTIQKLRRQVISDPRRAFFHVLSVDEISNEVSRS